MIDGAVYSGCCGGAKTVERIQSANRWDRLHIIFFKILSLAMVFFSISICQRNQVRIFIHENQFSKQNIKVYDLGCQKFILLKMCKSVNRGVSCEVYIFIYLYYTFLYSSGDFKQGMTILIILLNRRKRLPLWYTHY